MPRLPDRGADSQARAGFRASRAPYPDHPFSLRLAPQTAAMIRKLSDLPSARLGTLAVAVLAAVALSACQKKEAGPAPAAAASAPQVVAKVNGEEITSQQLDYAVHQRRGAMRGDPDANNRAALEELIDRELEAQQARKLKLDEQPQLQQTLEAFRRELLAREFLKNVVEKMPKPTDAEVQKYYDEHKAMFADRQSYNLKRYEITVEADKRNAVAEKAGSFKSGAELDAWLKSQGLKFETAPLVVASEQLQGPVGDRLKALKPGQALAQPGGVGAAAFLLESLQPAPKTLQDARPQIETVLGAELRRTTLSSAAKDLRKDAKVEYRGTYANPPAAAGSAASGGMSVPPAAASAASMATPGSAASR